MLRRVRDRHARQARQVFHGAFALRQKLQQLQAAPARQGPADPGEVLEEFCFEFARDRHLFKYSIALLNSCQAGSRTKVPGGCGPPYLLSFLAPPTLSV